MNTSEENDEEENEEENDDNEIYDATNNITIPKWFDVKEISKEKFSKIQILFKNEIFSSIKDMNMKELIKIITKLSLTYERIKDLGFSVKDCFDLINFKFDKNKKELYKKLQEKILKSQIKENNGSKNEFFFDDIESESWKMIMILISSDISNTSIFLQGYPGSGKSCAAKFYGSNRSFNNRNHILSINCHRDLRFDYLVGNYIFKNSKFEFVDGPLLTAMKNGEPFLLDEFNLCSEEILNNLLPIFKSNIKDKIYLKGVPEPIYIHSGFLFIATGNFLNEKGRKEISSLIVDEIKISKIDNINFNGILENILENEYPLIYKKSTDKTVHYKISSSQIYKINEALKNHIQFQLSLRQIKCLLERIQRFCVEENYETIEPKKIPIIYVLISYILPQLKIGENMIVILLKEFDSILEYNNQEEILKFVESEVAFVKTYVKGDKNSEEKKFIIKGRIHLETILEGENLPQVLLQTYFWIRMSCSLKSEITCENLLLIGPTSYKEYLLNKWLKLKVQEENIDTFYLTKNTETDNLMGVSSLDDEEKLELQINNLINKAVFYFELKNEDIKKLYDKKRRKKNYLKFSKNINNSSNYIKKCILKLLDLKDSFKNKNQIGFKTVTSFNLGIVSTAFIFGKKLIMKGIENSEPSVIERLNSILENPRYLILTEDNQKIFNHKINIPFNEGFSIFFTSREVFHGRLSEAFLSRCTVINCPNYNNKKYLTIKLKTEDNYEIICRNIVKNEGLEKNIIFLKKNLVEKEKNFEIEILRFIRWCKSAKNIYQNQIKIQKKLNCKYIVGISALRSIIDRYEATKREDIVNNYFYNFLPQKIYNLIKSKDNLEFEEFEDFPFEEVIYNNKKYIKSKYSELLFEFPNDEKPNNSSLKSIEWTKSAVDIADSILVALLSKTILVLEGPPGRGKTAISKATFNHPNIDNENLKRINFSLSTNKEDIFSRTIPNIQDTKVKTKTKKQGLILILEQSLNSTNFYKQGLILDEINLASDELLEHLYSYLSSLYNEDDEDGIINVNNKNYISPDGIKYENIGNIAVVATMNDARLSNSRTSLSNSFLNLCHFLNYQIIQLMKLFY